MSAGAAASGVPDAHAVLEQAPFGYALASATGELRWMNATLRAWLGLSDSTVAAPRRLQDLFDVAGRFYFETHIGPLLRMQGRVEELAVELACGAQRTLEPFILNAQLIGGGDLHIAVLRASERRRYEQELLRERRRTEEALELADAYAADMERFAQLASHDLQAPLRRIQQHVPRLARAIESRDDAEIARCLDVMGRATHRGQDLVEALLRYARSRTAPLTMAPVRLDALIRDVVSDLLESGAKGALVTVDLPALEVTCDAPLVRRLFENLVGNALKYHRLGVPPVVDVRLRTRADGTDVGFAVEDHGIGFAPDQARAIFEPFRRLVRFEEFAGHGVGLALVHSVVARHGWSIEAEGRPGQGATFTVWMSRADSVV